MDRFAGTAARQLELVDDGNVPIASPIKPTPPRHALRILRRDVYAELARRRRRALIAARHEVEKP